MIEANGIMKAIDFLRRNVTNLLIILLILLMLGGNYMNLYASGIMHSQSALGGKGLSYSDYSYGGQIKTTSVSMEMEIPYGKLEEKKAAVVGKALELGGILLDENTYNYESYSSAYLSLKVPHNRSKEFETAISKYGKIKHITRRVNDITEYYSNTQERIKYLEAYRERLLEMQKNASVYDMFQINKELKDVETELQSLKNSLKREQSSVMYDRYYITLQETKHPMKAVFSSASELARLFFGAVNAGLVVIVAIMGFAVPFLPIIAVYIIWKSLRK